MSLQQQKTPENKEPEKTKTEDRNYKEGLVSVKDVIAPGSIEVDFNHIRIDTKYYRTLFIASYPRFVGINWLSSLINFDASLNISMYIYPTDGKDVMDDLRRKITEMEAEISSDQQKGKMPNPVTQAKLEDALSLQSDLARGQERFFQFGLYVTISADSVEELNKINKNLEASLGSIMMVSKKATLQMEDGFKTIIPTCKDKLNITRNMDTTSLATTFPFVSSDLSDEKGILYGVNLHNQSLVIFDRFSMPNYNSVVLATAGAGKSYLVKLEALRSLMFGTDIIIIDPENEYRELCEASGGQYIAFGYNETSKINPMDLSLAQEEGENSLSTKALSLHTLFKVMIGEMSPMEESILDKAIMDAYRNKGITQDIESQKKEAPLLEDVYKILIGNEDNDSKNVAVRMEKFIKGSFSGIFNQKTTVSLGSNFVVFGIKNLEEAMRPIAMHIVLDYIWTVVRKELKRRIMVVDEAWYLMQYPDTAKFLRGIVKRGRKYYLGVTTITQDVDDFLKTEYGKEIVTNSAIQILLKQHSASIDQIGEVFFLSQGEKQLLLNASKGEGIFFAGQNHVAIGVIASEEENRLITTDPQELLKLKQKTKDLMINKPSLPENMEEKEIESFSLKKEAPFIEKKTTTPTPPEAKIVQVQKQEEKKPVELDKPSPTFTKTTVDEENEIIIPVLQRRVSELEKQNIEASQKRMEEIEKKQDFREKQTITFKDEIPKLEDLFKPGKPLFQSETPKEETKIPQPPQLQKKPLPVFGEKTKPVEQVVQANQTEKKPVLKQSFPSFTAPVGVSKPYTPKQTGPQPLAKIDLVKKPVDLRTGKVVEETTKEPLISKPPSPAAQGLSPLTKGEQKQNDDVYKPKIPIFPPVIKDDGNKKDVVVGVKPEFKTEKSLDQDETNQQKVNSSSPSKLDYDKLFGNN